MTYWVELDFGSLGYSPVRVDAEYSSEPEARGWVVNTAWLYLGGNEHEVWKSGELLERAKQDVIEQLDEQQRESDAG